MTKNELYDLAIGSALKDNVPELYRKILEECCELVVEYKMKIPIDEQVTIIYRGGT